MFSKQLAKFKNKTKIMTSLRVSGPLHSLRILRIERIGSGNNNKFIALQLYFTLFTLFLQYLQAFFKVTTKAFTFYFHCVTYSRLQDIELFKIMVPNGFFFSHWCQRIRFDSIKNLSVSSYLKNHFFVWRIKNPLWNGKLPWMLKVLRGTINANKEPLYLGV